MNRQVLLASVLGIISTIRSINQEMQAAKPGHPGMTKMLDQRLDQLEVTVYEMTSNDLIETAIGITPLMTKGLELLAEANQFGLPVMKNRLLNLTRNAADFYRVVEYQNQRLAEMEEMARIPTTSRQWAN